MVPARLTYFDAHVSTSSARSLFLYIDIDSEPLARTLSFLRTPSSSRLAFALLSARVLSVP